MPEVTKGTLINNKAFHLRKIRGRWLLLCQTKYRVPGQITNREALPWYVTCTPEVCVRRTSGLAQYVRFFTFLARCLRRTYLTSGLVIFRERSAL